MISVGVGVVNVVSEAACVVAAVGSSVSKCCCFGHAKGQVAHARGGHCMGWFPYGTREREKKR